LEVERYDLRRDRVERSVGETVTANLLGPLLMTWAERLRGAAERPRTVVASGLLVGEVDRVAEAFAGVGFGEKKRDIEGDWAALVLTWAT
jgi:ribosomal protein L11 methylase PrmA